MTLHDISKTQFFEFFKKKLMWIFCPQMTLHDIPKIPQIGANGAYSYNTYGGAAIDSGATHDCVAYCVDEDF